MVKIARIGISTSNFQKISDIRWCQNSRLFEGFHPLSHESVLTSLFRALSVRKVTKKGVPGAAQCGSMAQNIPLGPLYTEKKENLLAHNF